MMNLHAIPVVYSVKLRLVALLRVPYTYTLLAEKHILGIIVGVVPILDFITIKCQQKSFNPANLVSLTN